MNRSVMTSCPHTGISVPECSCQRCLEAQVREHQPSLLAAPAITHIAAARSTGRIGPGSAQRHAA